ncbi:carbohydrate ABC transporter permease [Martelella alba]|uniref:Sugar ABC transporter permease n=1 Tax=Martelella alba TaxID=2590451 RepID=A0ABY2SIN4_9HYPH|nr:sugar ABC transporter permease [Martelella alba]TKI04668.1 sugar ABC transporter permease [Martelella alba]
MTLPSIGKDIRLAVNVRKKERTGSANRRFFFFFIFPSLLLVAAVSLYPIIDAVYLSLFSTRYAETVAFVGLQNFVDILSDQTIHSDFFNTVIYTAGSLILVLPYGLLVALLLNGKNIPFRGVLRTLAILPWVFSQTITGLLWGWLLNADFGAVTYFLQQTFHADFPLLSSPHGAMAALIVVNVWASYPLATLLFIAALQTIPQELYEAMRVDGAGPVKLFRYITLPLIRPTLQVIVIQLTLLYVNMVTLIYVMTGGGPVQSTETLGLRILKMSFEDWDIGHGAALGLILTLINFALSLFYVRALRGTTR